MGLGGPPFELMFIHGTKKSPKGVLEHSDPEKDNHQSKGYLVRHLRGVVVRSLVRHNAHLSKPTGATISTYGGRSMQRIVLIIMA